MSGAISNGYGIMPALLRNIDKLNAQNDQLSAQTSTGVISNSYAGLGDQADEVISLQPQISATAAWQTSLTQTQAKLNATQTALAGISAIATTLQTTLVSLTASPSASTIASASASAKQQLATLTSLLNTQSGSSFVFAGSASDQPPVNPPGLASSSMVASIMSAVSQVGTAGAGVTEAATLVSAADNSTSGSAFSAQLSVSAASAAALVPQVQAGQSETMATGVIATQGGAATSESTGSSIRDLIRSLATVAGLSGADSSSTGFQSLVSNTSTQMGNVGEGLQGMIATVGMLQKNATDTSSNLTDVNDALTSQLTAATGADLAVTRTQQIAVQNQLTASYTLIADMKDLNLAQYL